MGQSESVLLTPALVPCWLGRAMPQAEPSSCASSAATAATFPLLSRTVTPLPAAQCCPAELWWEKKRGLGGCPCHPPHPRAVPQGSLAQAGTGGSSSRQCWGLGTSLLSSIFSRSFWILPWSLAGGWRPLSSEMCCSPPHPCCWAVARAVRESFLGGLCTHSHPHQPLRQPLQLSREQCQDGTCTGQGHRGLRWEGAGVCVPPGTSARGPELTPGTAPPTPRKPGLALPDTPHSPKRFLTKLDACGCCHPHPGVPPYWRGRQRPDPPNLCTTLGASWGFINWRGWVSPPTGNS